MATVHRHRLAEQLLADIAVESGLRATRGRRREGLYRRGVEILVRFLRCNLQRAAFVFSGVDELQKVMELGGDSRLVDVGFLADRAMGDCGGVHGSVHAPETKHMATPLHDGLVGQVQAYRAVKRLPFLRHLSRLPPTLHEQRRSEDVRKKIHPALSVENSSYSLCVSHFQLRQHL